jgi:hypothetical protein
MSTGVFGLSRFVAAAGATVITAVGAWAFLSSTASIERDPFQFASTMAANAKVRIAQLHNRAASTCPNNPEARDPRDPVCVQG